MGGTGFHPAVTGWFEQQFPAATDVQREAWAAIASGANTLISAPTGSGKTLAAFLAIIDGLVKESIAHGLDDQTRVLYVSPLKALSNDIQKNLQAPLAGIRDRLLESGLPDAPIRAWLRTGDTPQSERARMRNRPPHILVTTPESLYILLTSASGREMLRTVGTVILDEIHAVAVNKRGAHLALSLARLDDLCERPPVRVGISATIKPIDVVVEYLTSRDRSQCTIVDAGHQRSRDLQIELPSSPLEAVMANEIWIEIYDRLAELIASHRTTLVFVNTRRMAERLARHLAERCGAEHVTAHHGSLAKEHRLKAEEALKAGRLKALVATASLELGIDIGDVDLVCQLGSPRAISTFLQRVGRSGHGIERLPKGRLLPLSRDELVESVALLESIDAGNLDHIELCRQPLDVLAQQIVAEVSMGERGVDELFASVRRTAPYADLSCDDYLAVIKMLAEGFSTQRGRRSAYLHHDRVNGVLRPRRSARLTAVTNGGAIPDQFDYDVVRVPDELFIGTLNEDFAFESLPGDIFQLGNSSYRIVKVTAGKVFVEDAHGQPPTIPFWFGEAPGRSDELSAAVSALRARLDRALAEQTPERVAAELADRLRLMPAAAEQVVDYLAGARAALGRLPTAEHLVIERFFDETGDAHLVIHSPLGSRINRAWGLALRKRFCRRFNFELQAAALEDAIVISLGAVHSFALEEVAAYLSSKTVANVLAQAVLAAPMFPGHWRWNATIALAVRRFRNGRKAPAAFQRNDAEDLMATVFPDQLACAENIAGEREIPDHPLVKQTMHDCLRGVMDLDGLRALLERIETGRVEIHCRELTSPSPLAQEVLCAKPYAFLDDAPAEERRTLAVQARRYLTVAQASDLGRLDARAIERVRNEAWPAPRDLEELHDSLVSVGFLTLAEAERGHNDAGIGRSWVEWLEALAACGRATRLHTRGGAGLWVAAERLRELQLVHPNGVPEQALVDLDSDIADADSALRELTRSRLACLGPVRAIELARALNVGETDIFQALVALEVEGVAMRGDYTSTPSEQIVDGDRTEWCERSLLARIHRYTLNRLRSEIEPVTVADYQRFLFEWQGLGRNRRSGVEAAAAVLTEFQGVSVPAIAWEQEILPARLEDYTADFLDQLTAGGAFVWLHPALRGAPGTRPRRLVRASPIAILPRHALPHWLALLGPPHDPVAPLSSPAARVAEALEHAGALFFLELVQTTGLLRVQTEEALAELAAAGRVSSDSFRGLRALMTPQSQRRGFHGRARRRGPDLDSAGRWALIRPASPTDEVRPREAIEHAARSLLWRYGVVCRRALEREQPGPSWRELLGCFRTWEARGEIRGGRFVDGLGGEQFALDEALPVLRRVRRDADAGEWLVLAAADPLNLAGILTPGGRVAAVAGHRVVYRGGVPVASVAAGQIHWLVELGPQEQAVARRLIESAASAARPAAARRRFR
jgi:ATP-dependent Lhr-like helicase